MTWWLNSIAYSKAIGSWNNFEAFGAIFCSKISDLIVYFPHWLQERIRFAVPGYKSFSC